MSKTTVIYKDVAVGAAEDANFSVTESTEESIPNKLAAGVSPGAIISLEHNRWILNGAFSSFYEQSAIAFWSNTLSADDCTFTANPVITISFSQQFSSMGISLSFDVDTGEYCSLVNIKWYQGNTLKEDQDFTPDSVQYFCSKRVESYDRVVIELKKTSLPKRRAKVNHIVFGVERQFGMNELRSARVTNEMDESLIELPISSFHWTLDSLSDVDYLFQLKQPIEIKNDANLVGVYYIDGATRISNRVYDIECHDSLGVLDEMPFSGGAYLSGISAKTLLETLCAPFSVKYSDGVTDTTLKGILASGSRRAAIQQVIFAWGVCLATDGGADIRVFNLPETIEEIPKSRTFTGASVDTAAIVTAVKVTAHTYTADSNGSIAIGGSSYKDTETIYTVENPNVTATDRQNVKEITGATMVSTDIGQAVANRIYNYYSKRDTISAKIVYNGEKLGDRVSIFSPWDTQLVGNIAKMEISVSNTIAVSCEAKGAAS